MKEKNVVQFPARAEHLRKKSELADYLRTMADYIDSDGIELPALAIAMVITSQKQHEVLGFGYDKIPGLFADAIKAASKHSRCTYKRRGGNKYEHNN